MNSVEGRLARIETKIDEFKERFDRVDERFDRMDGRSDRMNSSSELAFCLPKSSYPRLALKARIEQTMSRKSRTRTISRASGYNSQASPWVDPATYFSAK